MTVVSVKKCLAKWLQRFVKTGFKKKSFFFKKKSSKIGHFGPYDLVQISPACGLST